MESHSNHEKDPMHDPLVRRAKACCEAAHAGQTRYDGTDYAVHPHRVACILLAHGISDPALLAAAYLHDVLEDTPTPRSNLKAEFGDTVVNLVEALTNIGPSGRRFEEKQKMLLEHARSMSPEAKLIKLADRLDNLRDMGCWPAWKQERYRWASEELLEALSPVPDEALAEAVRRAAATP